MNWYHLMMMMPITSPMYKEHYKQTLHSPVMVEVKYVCTFGEYSSNDYTGPPLIPDDELKHSSEDEFDGPYATADQVAQREKRMQGHQEANDGGLK